MQYRSVNQKFFESVTTALPEEWGVSSSANGCNVSQWFEPETNDLVAQSVRVQQGAPSFMLHEAYAQLEQRLA